MVRPHVLYFFLVFMVFNRKLHVPMWDHILLTCVEKYTPCVWHKISQVIT